MEDNPEPIAAAVSGSTDEVICGAKKAEPTPIAACRNVFKNLFIFSYIPSQDIGYHGKGKDSQ
jgi:hypothetical protein